MNYHTIPKNTVFAILSGILLGIPFCFPTLSFLIFFAWIPLLWIENRVTDHPNQYLIFNHSFLSFIIWNTMACWWISQAQLLGAILIIILNSSLLALIFWLVSRTHKILNTPILLPFLIIWLGFEYFHTYWDLAWPWLNLGNTFASTPHFVQWYEFTGTRGGSLWIILVNLSLFKIITQKKDFRYSQAIVSIALLGVPVLYSFIVMNIKESSQTQKTFTLIQPNLDPYTEKFVPDNERKHFNEFISMADSICKLKHPDYLFAPETLILQPIDENQPEKSKYYLDLLELQKKYPNTEFLIGVHSSKPVNGKIESYNSALFLSGSITKFYHKTKLVPLFERIPFDKYLEFLNDYSLEIGGYHGTYSSRNDMNYFNSDSGSIVPVVCFESIFGNYCAKRVPETAGFFCMITNDGWWKNTPGYQYHFNFSRLRAIETGKHYIRVANNGISAHINSKGMIIAKTKWWKKTTLTGELSLLSSKTFYSKHGDYIGRICLFFAVLLLIFVKIRAYISHLPGKKI